MSALNILITKQITITDFVYGQRLVHNPAGLEFQSPNKVDCVSYESQWQVLHLLCLQVV